MSQQGKLKGHWYFGKLIYSKYSINVLEMVPGLFKGMLLSYFGGGEFGAFRFLGL